MIKLKMRILEIKFLKFKTSLTKMLVGKCIFIVDYNTVPNSFFDSDDEAWNACIELGIKPPCVFVAQVSDVYTQINFENRIYGSKEQKN